MSEVKVPYSDDVSENATLLLGAAEELGLEPYVVRTQSEPYYLVPREVAEKAGVDFEDPEDEQPSEPEEKKPARKTTTKKAAASKSKSK